MVKKSVCLLHGLSNHLQLSEMPWQKEEFKLERALIIEGCPQMSAMDYAVNGK